MPYDLIIKAGASQDTTNAYLYYEGEKDGLGERFLAALKACYEKILENPEYYSFISPKGSLRDVKIKGYPYVVVYDVEADEVIIYSIHNSYKKNKGFYK
jgi:plasmid stabilization system protein ParE